MPVDKKAESSSQNFVAGAVAGCLMRTTLFPIDTIKTNMQRSGTGLVATVRSLLSSPSVVAALYRGLTPAVLEIGVNRGALMSLSTAIKDRLPADLSEVTCDAAAGLVAGSIKTIVLHPLDTLTCRGQVGRAQLALIWPRPQVSVLYGGLSPAIVRSAGGMAIWLSVRNSLERKANSIESLQGSPWLRDWLVGMASTAFTDLCTFPLDTLKKNLQADGGNVEWPISLSNTEDLALATNSRCILKVSAIIRHKDDPPIILNQVNQASFNESEVSAGEVTPSSAEQPRFVVTPSRNLWQAQGPQCC